MKKKYLHIIISFLVVTIFIQTVHGQEDQKPKKRKFLHNILNKVKSSITVSLPDSVIKATVLNTKSVNPFSIYKGKVIRNILTEELGFEKVFTDTSKRTFVWAIWLNAEKGVDVNILKMKFQSRLDFELRFRNTTTPSASRSG